MRFPAGDLDLHRRALPGVAEVSADTSHLHQVLDSCEQLVAVRPELEVLSVRRRVLGPEDRPAPRCGAPRREDTGRHG